jgi:hypothetical protein
VGTWEVGDRFGYAGLIPGFDYESAFGMPIEELLAQGGGSFTVEDEAPAPNQQLLYAASHAGTGDADGDMIADHFEEQFGLDPNNPDFDGDGITDGYELMVLHTDPTRVDSDFDGMNDDIEIAFGRDPTRADNPDGTGVSVPDSLMRDSDGDGIDDYGEELLGTNPLVADSDGDGVIDGAELMSGTDPLDPASGLPSDIGTDPLDSDSSLPSEVGSGPADA